MVDGAVIAFAVEPGDDWVAAFRFANRLVRGGHRVLLATGMSTSSTEESAVSAGSFIVPLSPTADPGLVEPPDAGQIRAMAERSGVTLAPLTTRCRVIAAPLSPIRVGLYGGGGAPFNQASILAECGFPIRFLSDAEIRAGELSDVDALVVPGGGFRAMHGQLEPLGEAGCRAIAEFVRRGGMYVGSCAGSYDCAIVPEDFVRSCPAQRHLQLINVRVWNDASVDFGALQSPGVGVVHVRNERPDHPVMYGLPAEFEIAHYNGPIFDPAPPTIDGSSEAIGLAAFAGVSDRFTPSEAFAGPVEDGGATLMDRAIAAGRFSAVSGYLGRGRVVAFGSHPEFGFDLPMVDWGLPARMLANAALWQASSQPESQREDGAVRMAAAGRRIGFPLGSAYDEVAEAAAQVSTRVARLRARSIDPPPVWLTPAYAMSFFGSSPQAIWRASLDDIDAMAMEIAGRAADLRTRIRDMMSPQPAEIVPESITRVEGWLLDERPPEWRQDGGYQGVIALLRTAARMCDAAIAQWEVELGPPAGAYAYLHENPYHLVAGSYLAAVGCVAGAVHLLRAAAADLDMADQLARDQVSAREAPQRLAAIAT